MKDKNRSRIDYVYFFFLIIFAALALRISYLQIFRRSFLHNLSQKQYYRLIQLMGKRGQILDREGKILATDLSTNSIFADPSLIEDASKLAGVLAKELNLSKEQIFRKLTARKRFVWIKRKVSWKDKEKIASLDLKGVGFIREGKRFHPHGNIASSILGVVDIDNNGLEGVELEYNNYLGGKIGWVRILQDSSAREVIVNPSIIEPQEGASLHLTIDLQIQYWTEYYLKQTIEEFGGSAGSIVVMDAKSGEILALANYPFSGLDAARNLKFIRNHAVVDQFEPGSVFKVITLIAAIEENKFSDEDKFFCENGEYKIPGSILHDWKPYGMLTFKEVFKKSSNIGVSKVATSMGKEVIYRYIKKFEFGQKSGIDLPGEVRGSVKKPQQWSRTSEYIIPIGQGIGINLIQLMRPFAAVANGGYLVKPHIAKEIQGQLVTKKIPCEKKRVISLSTAERAKRILIGVVEEGTGALARIKGAKVGGKTGTAQKYDPQLKGYSPTNYRATFVGFVSSVDSPFVVGVSIDEPRKHHFGGVVAAPLFKKVAERVIVLRQGKTITAEPRTP